ncbi:hypothetical protein N752_16790 [Desulforamulus aquiferis]|nr:hypothetical protein N752_16790 [Desulforamulus aquiferis]
MELLQETLSKIQEPNRNVEELAQRRLDNLTKPLGSLGVLEEIASRLAGIQGQALPKLPKEKAIIVLAGDHGVTNEGVSASHRR